MNASPRNGQGQDTLPGQISLDNQSETAPDQRRFSWLTRVILPLTVLAVGLLLANWLLNSGQKANRKPPERNSWLVEVEKIGFGPHTTIIEAMGVIRPAQIVELRPRVSGEIVEISPELLPGGRFLAGDLVARIDPTDFDLAIRQRQTEVAKARSTLRLELGQQAVAEQEYHLLGETIAADDRDLVLRKPQLDAAQASLDAAQVAVDLARLNLERTKVSSPFNAVVQTFNVNLGAQVSPTTTIASLVGTDEYWVEVSVPVIDLEWIRIPDGQESSAGSGEGSKARVFHLSDSNTDYRIGQVIRLASELEESGRMARLLVAVSDPLALRPEHEGHLPLLIGTYVRVEIEGRPLTAVAALDRQYIREGDRVWIMNAQNQLETRPVQIVFRDREKVYIGQGIAEGERLVTSDLAAPVDGMSLRTESYTPEPVKPLPDGATSQGPIQGGRP